MNTAPKGNYRWYIMALGALTNALVVAAPGMGLSVLLPEISKDLHLSIVQAGFVWGIVSLPAIVTGLLAGSLCDRFGPKAMLSLTCLVVGLAGAARGLANGFEGLMIIVFIGGVFSPAITVSNFKNAAMWFEPHERGVANGIATLGMAGGFFLGALISASYLSPLLGGWRNVFFAMGGIAAMFSFPWLFSRKAPVPVMVIDSAESGESMLQGIIHLFRQKEIWFLGLAVAAVCGGAQGVMGYMPLYLQGAGWSVPSASGVVASFNIASMIGVLPLSFLSDRMGSRKKFLVAGGLVTAIGVGIASMAKSSVVWAAMIFAGSVRDAFMAISMASANQYKGELHTTAGIATGLLTCFTAIGSLLAPPAGNSLATMGANVPLIGWAVLIFLGSMCILLPSMWTLAAGRKQKAGVDVT
jgi:MFS family permease